MVMRLKIAREGARKVTRRVKSSPHKRENLSSNPQHQARQPVPGMEETLGCETWAQNKMEDSQYPPLPLMCRETDRDKETQAETYTEGQTKIEA